MPLYCGSPGPVLVVDTVSLVFGYSKSKYGLAES